MKKGWGGRLMSHSCCWCVCHKMQHQPRDFSSYPSFVCLCLHSIVLSKCLEYDRGSESHIARTMLYTNNNKKKGGGGTHWEVLLSPHHHMRVCRQNEKSTLYFLISQFFIFLRWVRGVVCLKMIRFECRQNNAHASPNHKTYSEYYNWPSWCFAVVVMSDWMFTGVINNRTYEQAVRHDTRNKKQHETTWKINAFIHFLHRFFCSDFGHQGKTAALFISRISFRQMFL